jgi:hypothetical protein
MPAKRGERVTPPAKPGGWDLRYATSDAVKGWEQLSGRSVEHLGSLDDPYRAAHNAQKP